MDEFGLAPALRWYVSGFEQRSGIHVTLDAPDDLPRLAPEVETTVYRIVQETLTNIHRHSGSSLAHIFLDCHEGRLDLRVEDQGHGLDDVIAAEARGVGLAGIRQRVQELGGTMQLASSPQGTKLTVELPLRAGGGGVPGG